MVEVAARIRRMPLGALRVKAGVAAEADGRDVDEADLERTAMLERTPSPVELVAAWLAPASDTSRVQQEAEGRDTDEAPLGGDNSAQEQSVSMEEPYATVEDHHEDGHHPVSSDCIVSAAKPGTNSVVDHLLALAGVIDGLEHELVETRERTEAQENELAELRQARASDLNTLTGLATELEQRRGHLDALRAVVGDLTVELDN
jgi:hypothetical protein